MGISAIDKAANAIGWIEALIQHGDDLPQGKKRLGNVEIGFCCLGLGCAALGIRYNSMKSASGRLQEKTGLKSSLGMTYRHEHPALFSLNDDHGKTLKEIGVIMRCNADAYFETEVADIINQMYEEGVV